MRISDFLRSDSGATTVDWVVLTASATGLSLGTFIVVSGGVSGMSTTIGSTLSGYEISGAFAEAFEAVQLAAADFAGGALGGWTGGSAADAGGAIGEVLMLGPGDIAELALDVPEGASQAVFTFDLIGGDSLDGETATVMINGQPVSIATGGHGTIRLEQFGHPGVTVETTVQAQGQQLGRLAGRRMDRVRDLRQHHRGQPRPDRDARRRLGHEPPSTTNGSASTT
jgi:Flp pilus assembly pilin Flp